MNKSWKKFTVIVSALLCVMIVCLIVNVSIDKVTNSILPTVKDADNANGNYSSQINGGYSNQGSFNDNQQGVAQNPATDANGTVAQQGSNTAQQGANTNVQQNANQSQGQASAANPLNYSKSQLIAYYNSCLNKSYSQPKMNARKVEHVDVSVSGIDIGGLGMDVDKFAQDIIANNTKNNDVPKTMSFQNGKAGDGTAASSFVLPANLYDGAVKSINAAQSGSGYKITIVLNQESCAHNGTAKYNASCAWPLDVNVIDFGQAVTINSCTFNYPGTVLTAIVDNQGRVTNVKVEMPLTVANAQAKAIGINITVGSISGKWTCTNTMSF